MERTQPTAAPDDASEPDLAPWPSYDPGNFYDELVGPRGVPRPAAETLWRHFTALGPEALAERQMAADHEMRAIGVTFTVYEGSAGVDRPWPFDIMPRMMPSDQWQTVESGLVRWKQVAAELAGLGSSGLLARRTKLARLLRNEGATYNVTQDNQSRRQPWLLDPCPLVVDESEWAALESGVAQRVTLLDLILADIYANRRLVAEGLIPAELVLGHPPSPDPVWVWARRVTIGCSSPRWMWSGTAGHFRAIGDRTQAPSGLGYALVNRTILSRVLPNLHRESAVERLVGADASHAWPSVFVPGWGCLDVDPTNDRIVGSTYVTTAWGRDYADVSPLKGIVFGGGDSHMLDVSVDVTRSGAVEG